MHTFQTHSDWKNTLTLVSAPSQQNSDMRFGQVALVFDLIEWFHETY